MNKTIKAVLLLITAAALTGCAATQEVKRTPLLAKELSLSQLSQRNGISFSWDSISHAVFLSRGDASASALVGSDIVLLDNQKIILSAPLKIEGGEVIVPRDFNEKVIIPLTAVEDFVKDTPSLRMVKKVIIDAGHGGKDPGAIGKSGTYEKDFGKKGHCSRYDTGS